MNKTATAPTLSSEVTEKKFFTLKVISDGTTGQEWIKRLNYKLDEKVQHILLSKNFKPTVGVVTQIVIIPGSYLKTKIAPKSRMAVDVVRQHGESLGYRNVDLEAFCLLRNKLTDGDLFDGLGFGWITGISNSVDIPSYLYPFLLGIYPLKGNALEAFDVKPGGKYTLEGAFAFENPKFDCPITVDRSVKPFYPRMKKPVHQVFENHGLSEYLLNKVSLYAYESQKKGQVMSVDNVYDFLRKDMEIASCLNLQDGLAIQAMGLSIFRKLFAGKYLFLWKSIVEDTASGQLSVPYLCEYNGAVEICWHGLQSIWYPKYITLRF